MKKCTKCGVVQSLDNFYKAKGTRDGYRGDCRACFRAWAKARYPEVREQAIARAKQWRVDNIERFRETQRNARSKPEAKRRARDGHLRRKFGITVEDYERMLGEQDGGCAICGRPPKTDVALHVDHDEVTGQVRALLCFSCNNLLGDVHDDPSLLRVAAEYLETHHALTARRRARALVDVRLN
jgi:hypothetical protein